MRKVYILVKGELGKLGPDNLCVFASEGEAEQAAAKHRSDQVKAWVEEVNFYE